MKSLTISVLMICVIMSLGCDKEETRPEERTIGMADVLVIDNDPVGCNDAEICNQMIRMQWTDNETGTKYYRLRLIGQGTAYNTEVIASAASGSPSEVFEVPYTSGLPPGAYEVEVHKVLNYQATAKQRLVAATSANSLILDEFCDECFVDCCTDGYFYSGVHKGLADVLGAMATIDTPAPWLCGEQTGSMDIAHSNVYVAIINQLACASNDSIYAEAGFLKYRLFPDPVIAGWYGTVKVQGESPLVFGMHPNNVPVGATIPHNYSVLVNSGTIFLSLDGSVLASPAPPAWQSVICDQAIWTAEIRGHETDMARMPDPSNACWFRNCKYYDFEWKALDLAGDAAISRNEDDPDEWKLSYGIDNDFSVKDLHLQPSSK